MKQFDDHHPIIIETLAQEVDDRRVFEGMAGGGDALDPLLQSYGFVDPAARAAVLLVLNATCAGMAAQQGSAFPNPVSIFTGVMSAFLLGIRLARRNLIA